MKRINIFLCLVIIFSCIAGYALLHPGLPPTHDGEYHIIRFYEFDKVLRSGSLYPRWAPDLNNGYGVPLFNYVYPLPNYIASFLHVFGVSFIEAFKLNLFFATLLGGIFFYFWAKQYWGDVGGLIASTFYTFSPYHFVDIYIRGSVGEVWALAFFPAFLWSITNVIKKKNRVFVIFSGLFLALIIFSHNILALMFFPFALSYVGFLIYREENRKYLIRNTLYIILFGLGLSAIFWIPALLEKDYVTGLQIYDVEKNFPQLHQLLIPSWGSGFSEGSLEGQMSFQIGLANLIAIVASMLTAIVLFRRKQKEIKIIAFFLAWFAVLFFLMLPISLPVWENVPLLNYFQFPWRLLSLIILICSFLAGSVVFAWKSRVFYVVFLLLPVFLGISYAKPAFYHDRNDAYYISRSNFIDGTNSPGDLFNTVWFNKGLKKQKEKIIIQHGEVRSTYIRPTKYIFGVRAYSQTQITVNTAYFPGWTAIINNNEIDIKPNNNGLITFFIPKGDNKIELVFKDTFIRTIAISISFVSFFL